MFKKLKSPFHPAVLLCLAGLLLLGLRISWWNAAHWESARHVWRLPFLFLVWNLCLAWIPWQISRQLGKAGPLMFWAGFVVWLLFLPNAPYLVTDLIHLRHRAPIPLWYDALVFFLFAVAGWVLGSYSLAQMDRNLRQRLRPAWTNTLMGAAILLSGLGVYIGRFRRWNSWDALLRPDDLLADLLGSFTQTPVLLEALLFSGLMAALLALSYWITASPNYTGHEK